MSTELAVSHQHLVALTPGDVGPAQQQLRGWCQAKILALSRELREHRENYRHAITHKWKAGPWRTAINATKKRMVYYVKIRKAVEAGYLVVPNFPIEVMAVRVTAGSSPPQSEGRWNSDVNKAEPQLLPPGTGQYVNEITETIPTRIWDEHKQNPATPTQKGMWVAGRATGEYTDPDFPVTIIKPVVIDATARAMALKLFDRIGIANHGGGTTSRASRRADPIVIGQIIDPKYKGRWNEKTVSFFIAWWLNTESL